MKRALRPEIPPHVAEVIRRLVPDLKRSVKQALRSLCTDPRAGDPLQRQLEGLWTYRVRRFRIVYALDPRHRSIRIYAVGHRRSVYEDLAERRRRETGS